MTPIMQLEGRIMHEAEQIIEAGFAKPEGEFAAEFVTVPRMLSEAEQRRNQAEKEHAAAPNRHERRKRDALRRHGTR